MRISASVRGTAAGPRQRGKDAPFAEKPADCLGLRRLDERDLDHRVAVRVLRADAELGERCEDSGGHPMQLEAQRVTASLVDGEPLEHGRDRRERHRRRVGADGRGGAERLLERRGESEKRQQ